MSEFTPFIVFGIATGAIYGLSAMGLVLTYKTSGLFNFGHGALSAVAAFVFHTLHNEMGVPWPVAALVAVVAFGIVFGLLLERFAAALDSVSTTYKIVGTIGLLVGTRAAVVLLWGERSRVFPPFLSQGVVFELSGVGITVQTVLIVGLGAGSAGLLFVMFRTQRMGIAMRAVVDDSELLDMTGENPAAVRRLAWIVGMMFAAVSGVLFASVQQQIQVDILTLLVVQAFGAAAVARFTSLPISFVAGIGVGVLQALLSKQAAEITWMNGLDLNAPFLVLFAILLFARKGFFVEVGRQVKARAIPPSRFTPNQRRMGYVVAAAALVALPHVVGTRLPLWNAAMSQIGLFLSLSLLVRLSGQISLCQVGFAAIGAAAFGHFTNAGVPWVFALVLAGAVAVPVGALIAIPAIRLSGLYLGLATFGFGVLLERFFYAKSFMFGTSQQLATPRPSGFDTDVQYYYVLLAVGVAGAVVVTAIERARLGRLLRGLADAPVALRTLGTDTKVTLVLVFCLSAGLAAVSGATYGPLFGQVSGFGLPAFQSLISLVVLFSAGQRLISPAFVAPMLLLVLPGYLDDAQLTLGLQLAFGVVAFVVAAGSQGAISERFVTAASNSAARLRGPSRGVYGPATAVRKEVAR